MKRQGISRLAALVLAILACGAMAAAPQTQPSPTQKLIQRIVKSAKGHADTAAKLVAAAKTLQDDPKIQVAMCEAAYQYGIKTADGFDSAIEALDILDKADKDRAATWAEKRIVVYRLRYTRAKGDAKQQHGQLLVTMLIKTGDELAKQDKVKEAIGFYREALAVAKYLSLPDVEDISQKLIAAGHLLQVQSAIARLKTKLAANPGDMASRNKLIELCLTGLDSPAEAAKYLTDDCDESLRKYVPLAAKPIVELKKDQCLELAKWYEQLIDKGTTLTSKANAANRGVGYYDQFLLLHTTKDATGVGASLALKTLQKRIEKMGAVGKPVYRNRLTFRDKKSMKPFKKGKRYSPFPVQETEDAMGPFSGKGVYFDQKTGKDVIYEIYSSRPIKGVYYKGGAIYSTTIEFLDVRGKRLAFMGPLKGGNRWAEFTLKLPRGAPNHIFLKFHNTASTWFYIDTLKLLR